MTPTDSVYPRRFNGTPPDCREKRCRLVGQPIHRYMLGINTMSDRGVFHTALLNPMTAGGWRRSEDGNELERGNVPKLLFRFGKQAVSLAQKRCAASPTVVVSDPDGNGFADWKHLTLHFLRVHIDATYRELVGWASEMDRVRALLQLYRWGFPAPSTLCRSFERVPTRRFHAIRARHVPPVHPGDTKTSRLVFFLRSIGLIRPQGSLQSMAYADVLAHPSAAPPPPPPYFVFDASTREPATAVCVSRDVLLRHHGRLLTTIQRRQTGTAGPVLPAVRCWSRS
jgi:hypothetical protein